MGSGSMNEKSKIKNLSSILNNVKSVYFLQKIFYNIHKNKWLEILKYNKKLQKRLNLSINNYKEYSQLYSSIEIELKVLCDKDRFNYKFINLSDNDKEYYHIYFDDEKEEIKRNILTEEDKVKKIKIKIDYQVTSLKNLFNDCFYITSIYFKKFCRINITDMIRMFKEC